MSAAPPIPRPGTAACQSGSRARSEWEAEQPEPHWELSIALDLTQPDGGGIGEQQEDLEAQHERALALGAQLLLLDRFDDPHEPLRVYADPSGHPFCIFVGG